MDRKIGALDGFPDKEFPVLGEMCHPPGGREKCDFTYFSFFMTLFWSDFQGQYA